MTSKTLLGWFLVGMAFGHVAMSCPSHAASMHCSNALAASATGGKGSEEAASPSLKAGEKIKIDEGHYFIYDFDKKPQMGTAILKVRIFDNEGKQSTSYEVMGNSGMPSMRGAHDTGDQPFKLNKKGEYLLPVNVVMPGGWEVRLQFLKDKKPIFSGRIVFDV